MSTLIAQAIVLRHADYRDNDRMLTLLTPQGRVEALCRGCKRPNSPLLSASEWFAMGEYVFYEGKGKMTVTSCQLTESFYPLREDYDKLKYATLMLRLCEETAQPGQNELHLFTLLARSLFRLAYTDRQPVTVLGGFLLHFAVIGGYMPVLDRCVLCGKDAPDAPLFDMENGGIVCKACAGTGVRAFPLQKGQTEWMRQVIKYGIDKYPLADEDPPVDLLRYYIASKMENKTVFNR